MEPTCLEFNELAKHALSNEKRKTTIRRVTNDLIARRLKVIQNFHEYDALRDDAVAIKNDVLEHLDFYLEKFAAKVVESGGHVHWCSTQEQAREAVLEICLSAGAKSTTKGKSMISEEIALNEFLEKHGVVPVETDVGEHVLQLSGDRPSHIMAPVLHKSADEIGALFWVHHQKYGKSERVVEPEQLVAQVRDVLRAEYFRAEVGITGANFLIAETGSTVIVTNEGNGDLTQMLAKVHVVLASIEKVVPTLEDTATMLRVLARTASGQELTSYTTFSTGPRHDGDLDGPEVFHVVLYDGLRSSILGSEAREILRCIRCGACMNHCPVYQAAGGQAYGWVYPGPLGAVLNPALLGIERTHVLPKASTSCGRCEEVCPVRIPLPRLMQHYRERAFEERVSTARERFAISLWAYFAKRPRLYRWAARVVIALLALLGGRKGRFRRLPFAGGWTRSRDFPAPRGRLFLDLWKERLGDE